MASMKASAMAIAAANNLRASPKGRVVDESLLVSKKPAMVEDRTLATDHVAIHDKPWRSDVVVRRNAQGTAGVYGVGMKVDVPVGNSADTHVPFAVKNCSGLRDAQGRDISGSVSLGDILCFCNDRSVAKEGESIIETTIFGEKDSLLKLTFKNSKTGQFYDRTVKRHIPIREWGFERQWYDVKDELRGKELMTHSSLVEHLNEMRSTIIDPEGREMDFLAGIRKRGSHTGLHLANDRSTSKTVLRVVPGSPAWFAGLRKGDVISAVDGVGGEQHVAELLGGTERIGTVCRLRFQRSGQTHDVDVSRTQYSAMVRTEEMIDFIDNHPSLSPEQKRVLDDKVRELEKERQYEERVMSSRLNQSHSEILRHLYCAAETLLPPHADLTDQLLNSQASAADLGRDLARARERNAELDTLVNDLAAEVERLKAALGGMVPKADLDKAAEELRRLRQEVSDAESDRRRMVPRDELANVRAELKAQVDALRDEKLKMEQALKSAEDARLKLQEEAEELRRRLKALEDENKAVRAEVAGLRSENKELKDSGAGAGAKVATLSRQLEAVTQEAEELRSKLQAAEKERGELQGENFELKRKLTAALDEGNELRAEAEALRLKLKAEKLEGDRLASEKEGSARKLKAAEAELEELRSATEAMKKQLKELQDMKHDLEAKAERATRAAETLQKDLAEATEKLEAARKQNAELTRDLDKTSKKLKLAEAEVARLAAEAEEIKKELQAAKSENVELLGELEKSKQAASTFRDKAAALEKERNELSRQLEAAKKAEAAAAAAAKAAEARAREAEDSGMSLGAEQSRLQAQLQDAKEREEALQAQLQSQKAALAEAQEAAKLAKKSLEAKDAELAERSKELAKAQDAHAKALKELAGVERQLMDASKNIASLNQELKEKDEELAAAEARRKKMEQRMEEMKAAEAAALAAQQALAAEKTKLQTEVDKLQRQLDVALKRLQDEEKDHGETQEKLRGLLRELGAAELDDAKIRKEFLEAMTAPPGHTRAGVQRAMQTAKRFEGASMESLCDLWDTMLRGGAAASPAEVHALLQTLLDETPAREAKEVAAAVRVLNEAEAWGVAALKGEREELAKAGVQSAAELQAKHRERVRALMKPELETESCGFTGSMPLVVRGRPGSTVYVTMREDEVVPTTSDYDAMGVSPLTVTVEESSVVTAAVLVDGEELSEASSAQFSKRRVKVEEAPQQRAAPVERVGVGMLLHRKRAVREGEEEEEAEDAGSETDIELGKEIVVKEIYSSGEVEREGSIRVGDLLVEVDGVSVQQMAMAQISDLIMGAPDSEVRLLMERPAHDAGWGDSLGDLNPARPESVGSSKSLVPRGTRYEAKLLRRAERFGVGILASRPADGGSDVLVKEVFAGGSAAEDGTMEEGDVVVEVDGQAVEFLSMSDIWVLMTGPEGSEVTLLMERKEHRGQRQQLCADGLYTVTLPRKRVDEEKPLAEALQEGMFSVLDSGKNLFARVASIGAAEPEETPEQVEERLKSEKEQADQNLADAVAKYRQMLKLETLAPEKVPMLAQLESVSACLLAPSNADLEGQGVAVAVQ